MDDRILQGDSQKDEIKLDVSLRPKSLGDFIGQKELKEKLSIFTQAAKLRGSFGSHSFRGLQGLEKLRSLM